jgi:hypothetical protein
LSIVTELTQVLRKDFFKTDHFSVGYFCLIKNNGALKKNGGENMTSCPVGSILSSLDSLEKVIFPTSRQKKSFGF